MTPQVIVCWRTLLACLTLITHAVYADDVVERRSPKKYTNTTISQPTSPPVSLPFSTTISKTKGKNNTSASTTSTTSFILSSSDSDDTSISTLTNLPSGTATALTSNLGCSGSSFYVNTIPTTVFVTVTQGYDVTLSATDAAFTAPAILITDQTACVASTILSAASIPIGNPHNPNQPQQITETGAAIPPALYTSTVYVTKKTPVPVVEQTTSAPPVFHFPSSTNPPQPEVTTQPAPSEPSPSGPPQLQPENIPSVPSGKSSAPVSASPAPSPSNGSSPPAPVTSHAGPAAQSIPPPATSPKQKQPTTGIAPAISVGPSKVVIGTQPVAVPSKAQESVVQVSGRTYTVQPTQVVGPHTTVLIPQAGASHSVSNAASFVKETAAGVTLQVGSSQAIVGGHTYSIGPGAKPTTITSNGQLITIGPKGVGLASTTFAPLQSPTVLTSAGVIITLDSTQAVISGTTFQIGPAATPHTTVIAGQTISVGPSGLGFPSTTVNPAKMSALSGKHTGTGEASTRHSATVTIALPTGSNVNAAFKNIPFCLHGWMIVTVPAIITLLSFL